MIDIAQSLNVHIAIKDITNIDDMIKAHLQAFIGRCYNSMIVASIGDYSYQQDYIDIMNESCQLTFKVVFNCKCYRYYLGDFIWLAISRVDEFSFNLQNAYCSCYMLKNISNSFLGLGDYAVVRVMEPIYPPGEIFTSRVELYNPIPIVNKVTFHGKRSDKFNELSIQLNELVDNLDIPDNMFIQLEGTKLSLADLDQDITFYYNLNSYDHIGIYSDVVDIDSVGLLELDNDYDYIILNSMINRAKLIKSIDRSSPIFKHNAQIISSN